MAAIVLACVLVVVPVARAEQFVVNSTADEVDDSLGDESCHTAGGVCTLRAAIEEGDSLGESTSIRFEEGTFDGQASSTIVLDSELPEIKVPAFIEGTCETGGPCVGIDGLIGGPALTISGVEEGEISGLAIVGAETAISLEGAAHVNIRGNWLGVALDGTSPGNGTGVLVGPGSDHSFIGGEGTEHRNVFAGNEANGLDVHGAANVRVFGNYFGVEPDGVTLRPNGGDDIEVTSISEGPEAFGTEIGTRVNSVGVSSPLCDWGCNVISGATSNGIDLMGDGGSEIRASATSVAGNYIGLNADGTAALPNAGAGIRVGAAPHTIVGGPSAGETNRINGGRVGVLAGPAAGDLSVRGNLIGTDSTGSSALTPPDDGIVVDSAELPSPAVEAEIGGNEIGMEGGVGISQQGPGAWIFDNQVFGAQVGIRTFEFSEYGNVIEGNLIEDPIANGILIENNFNEVLGNAIFGAGGAGIWLQGALLAFGISGNLVGGNTAEDENFIAGSGGAAIEISSLEETRNEVARNTGIANGGPFIDLVTVFPATELGPNDGIKPPELAFAAEDGVGGAAEVGARVRVFRKLSAATGELESFLGETVADGEGLWEISYENPIPPGTAIAATQTSEFGGTSELVSATTEGETGIASGTGEGGGGNAGSGVVAGDLPGGPGGPIVLGRLRPRTKIVKAPKSRSGSSAVRFVFESDEPGSVFLCRLDSKPFDLCKSPKRYRHLEPGRHVFEVRAVDPAGHVDASPAKKRFILLG